LCGDCNETNVIVDEGEIMNGMDGEVVCSHEVHWINVMRVHEEIWKQKWEGDEK